MGILAGAPVIVLASPSIVAGGVVAVPHRRDERIRGMQWQDPRSRETPVSDPRPDLGIFAAAGDPYDVVACFEDLPAIVWCFDGPDHIVIAANRAARASVGDRNGIQGRPMREAVPELEGQEINELMDDVYSTGKPVVGREWRLMLDIDGDGQLEELFVNTTVVPRLGPDGGVRGVITHNLDVTEAVRERRAVRAEMAALEQRHQAACEVALTMQRNLLPSWLPVLPGLRLAAEYLVASAEHAAGGDWFDVVPVGGGRVGLVVGDVVGHGAAAAAVMGQLRAVLGELLVHGLDVTGALARLDRFADRVPGARGATVFLGILDPVDGSLQYASCGHPPPLVINAAGQHLFLPLASGGLLGSAAAPPRAESTLLLPGQVLLVYSDGLVERPGHSLQDGMTDLARVASDAIRHATADLMARSAADRVCELVMERLTRTGHADDVTLLAVELTGSAPETLELELPARPGQLGTLLSRLGRWLDGLGTCDEDVSSIRLAVLEAASNVVEHAYLDGEGSVRMEGHLDDGGRACLTVTDRGRWHPPQVDPGQRGRGLRMIRGCMDSVEVDSSPSGTVVLMERKLHRPVVLRSSPPDPPSRPRVVERPFTVEVIRSEQPRVVIGGPVDVTTADALRERLRDASRGGTLPLTVELGAVSHLGSAGVHLLSQLAEEFATDGRTLRLVAPHGCPAHQVLVLTGLDKMATVCGADGAPAG